MDLQQSIQHGNGERPSFDIADHLQQPADLDSGPDACIPSSSRTDPSQWQSIDSQPQAFTHVSPDTPGYDPQQSQHADLTPRPSTRSQTGDEPSPSWADGMAPFWLIYSIGWTLVCPVLVIGFWGDLIVHNVRRGALSSILPAIAPLIYVFFIWTAGISSQLVLSAERNLRGLPSRANAQASQSNRSLIVIIWKWYGFWDQSDLRERLSFSICVPIVFGLLASVIGRLPSKMKFLGPGLTPQTYRGCNTRVDARQEALFLEEVYKVQFGWKMIIGNDERSVFNWTAFLGISNDQNLCYQGFRGNQDLYGLGMRICIYLQWITSLLTNHLPPESRKNFHKAYLLFSLGTCLATMICSFLVPCTFSVEIEVLYIVYWGGFLCVFASAPSSTRLGPKDKWVGLNWITVIHIATHTTMIVHGITYLYYAYDQKFARMPCGTYHFFLVPLLDPSDTFWIFSDNLILLVFFVIVPIPLAISAMGLMFMPEIKQSIKDSWAYQAILTSSHGRFKQPLAMRTEARQSPLPLTSRISSRTRNLYKPVRKIFDKLREDFHLPCHRRSGIWLVTSLDIKDRR